MADSSTPATGTNNVTHLHLHGVEHDRARLNRLRKRLGALGLSSSLTLWRRDRKVQARKGAGVEVPEGAQEAICWTRASASEPEAALRAFAISCKENGTYLGLILDDVTPPATVTGAEDVELLGWDGAGSRQVVTHLLDLLQARQTEREAARVGGLSLGVERLVAAVKGVYQRLQRVYVISILGFLIAAFGFLGSWQSNWNGVCQVWGIHGLCGWFGWGSLPTAAQAHEWKAIEKTQDCEVLRAYLDRHGHDAPFSAIAENRIKLQRPADGVRTNSTRLEIPYWTQAFSPDSGTARSSLEREAGIQARDICATHAKAFVGLARPASFVARTEPACQRDAEGFRCGYGIEVTCTFRVKGDHMICPP